MPRLLPQVKKSGSVRLQVPSWWPLADESLTGLSAAGIGTVIGSPARIRRWRSEVLQRKVDCCHQEKGKGLSSRPKSWLLEWCSVKANY